MVPCFFLLSLLFAIIHSQRQCVDVPFIESGLEISDDVIWTLNVHVPVDDILVGVVFEDARDPKLDLEGDVVPGMEYWACAEEIHANDPVFLWPDIGVVGCLFEDVPRDPCTYKRQLKPVTWASIQEGSMTWFLLESTPEGLYDLTSNVVVTYNDASDGGVQKTFTGTTREEDLSEETLETKLGINVPDLAARITQFATTAPVDGITTLSMTMKLSVSDVAWDLQISDDNLPYFSDTANAAFDVENAVFTFVSGSTYDVTIDVNVCALSGTEVLSVVKRIQDQSVRYYADYAMEINLQALCPDTVIGTLPITGSTNLYSDSELSVSATEYYLGDTVYMCAVFSTYGDVASITLDSLTLTQSTTDFDYTSAASEVTLPSPDPDKMCISFPLASTLPAETTGVETTITGAFTLAYTSGRRRLKKSIAQSLNSLFSLRRTNCEMDDGSFASIGDLRTIPCANYGLQRQRCLPDAWTGVSDSCTYTYVGQLSTFQLIGLLISVSTLSLACVALCHSSQAKL